ncbi:MAG: hydrogenase maturation protease [Actinomycetota bacterium]
MTAGDPPQRPVRVIGVGNTMRHDDGVGIVAVGRLAEALAPGEAEVVRCDGEATRLIEAWSGLDRAVIVDGMRSGEPAGTVRRLEVGKDPHPALAPAASSHQAGLAEAVDLGRALARLPRELVVYGIEVEDVSPGEGLSPAVADQVPLVVERLAAEVGR